MGKRSCPFTGSTQGAKHQVTNFEKDTEYRQEVFSRTLEALRVGAANSFNSDTSMDKKLSSCRCCFQSTAKTDSCQLCLRPICSQCCHQCDLCGQTICFLCSQQDFTNNVRICQNCTT